MCFFQPVGNEHQKLATILNTIMERLEKGHRQNNAQGRGKGLSRSDLAELEKELNSLGFFNNDLRAKDQNATDEALLKLGNFVTFSKKIMQRYKYTDLAPFFDKNKKLKNETRVQKPESYLYFLTYLNEEQANLEKVALNNIIEKNKSEVGTFPFRKEWGKLAREDYQMGLNYKTPDKLKNYLVKALYQHFMEKIINRTDSKEPLRRINSYLTNKYSVDKPSKKDKDGNTLKQLALKNLCKVKEGLYTEQKKDITTKDRKVELYEEFETILSNISDPTTHWAPTDLREELRQFCNLYIYAKERAIEKIEVTEEDKNIACEEINNVLRGREITPKELENMVAKEQFVLVKTLTKNDENNPKRNELNIDDMEVKAVLRATQTTEFEVCGDTFMLFINRTAMEENKVRTKLTDHMKYTKDSTEYELIAGAIHRGGGISGGHYLAVIKRGKKYYYCNDDDVSEIDEKKAIANLAESSFLVYKEIKKIQPQ